MYGLYGCRLCDFIEGASTVVLSITCIIQELVSPTKCCCVIQSVDQTFH